MTFSFSCKKNGFKTADELHEQYGFADVARICKLWNDIGSPEKNAATRLKEAILVFEKMGLLGSFDTKHKDFLYSLTTEQEPQLQNKPNTCKKEDHDTTEELRGTFEDMSLKDLGDNIDYESEDEDVVIIDNEENVQPPYQQYKTTQDYVQERMRMENLLSQEQGNLFCLILDQFEVFCGYHWSIINLVFYFKYNIQMMSGAIK
jgi:hypothetical protein